VIDSLYLNVPAALSPAALDAQRRAYDAEHRAILDACTARDVATAQRLLRKHLESSSSRALAEWPTAKSTDRVQRADERRR
jgi:DNA-binding GntR family transcriptional regulator